MIIFNTTFSVDNASIEEFIDFVKQIYVVKAIETGELTRPRLVKILTENAESSSIALQFEVKEPEHLDNWYDSTGDSLNEILVNQFGDKVLGFSTIMEEVEL
ncbi:MAG: DUF4286 family protein [Bacteroidales bacterium]|nr:DUF4286 family protein [Bacteroidales bacterium]